MNNLDGTNTDMSSPAGSPVLSAPPARGLTRGTWVGLIVVVIVLAVVVVLGIASRSRSEAVLETENKQSSITDVAIIHPTGSAMTDEIALPGNTQAYVDTPIYSRTSGYLKAWYFDIGTHVRKGQLMAVIETPELDQQLQVAQADLKSSQANLDLAVTTAARYTNLLKTNSVSKQETDVATGDEAASVPPATPPRPTSAASPSCNRSRTSTLPSTASSPPVTPMSAPSSKLVRTLFRKNSSTSPPSARSASSSPFPRPTPRPSATTPKPPSPLTSIPASPSLARSPATPTRSTRPPAP